MEVNVYKNPTCFSLWSVSVGDQVFFLTEGETLIMPKGIPHAVYGEEKFKMLFVVSF